MERKRTRDWRKLHIGVNGEGFIVTHGMTENRVDDASVVPKLLEQVEEKIDRFTADGAYDKTAIYELLSNIGVMVIVPPTRKARF